MSNPEKEDNESPPSVSSEVESFEAEIRQRHSAISDEKDIASDKFIESESEPASEDDEPEPEVKVYRRAAVYSQRPSFVVRQYNNIKSFILELIDFVLLFLTTLFNPMADVNSQVQEHNQRKMAREGRFFASSCKPKTSSFPGCGPSS